MSVVNFTFQSGYIPISLSDSSFLFIRTFTFQSGYIPIPVWVLKKDVGNTLHSNLVIFQSTADSLKLAWIDLYIPIWLYSNETADLDMAMSESLYIPIWLYSNMKLARSATNQSLFTFQSGYIPILQDTRQIQIIYRLYIPIWLYSNSFQLYL